jgi:hypothetical protein
VNLEWPPRDFAQPSSRMSGRAALDRRLTTAAKLRALPRARKPETSHQHLDHYRSHTIPTTTPAITRIAPRMYLFFPSHDSDVPNPPLKSKEAKFCGISRAGSA